MSRDRLMSDEFLGTIIRKAGWREKAGKLGRNLSTAALLAAPFTGGTSAIFGAGLRTAGRQAAKRGAREAATKRRVAGKAVPSAEAKVESLRDSKAAVKRPAPASERTSQYYRNLRVKENPELMRPGTQTSITDDFGPQSGPFRPGHPITSTKPIAPLPSTADHIAAENYQRTLPAREALADKRAQGFETKITDAQSEVDALKEQRKTQGKLHETLEETAAADEQGAKDLALVGVQSQQASMANAAEEDRQRREADYERATENAGTGGAKSTTTG